MNAAFPLTVNGVDHDVTARPGATLMDVLRTLGYVSVKNGCDHGDCGTCAVLMDGNAVNACLVFAIKAAGSAITTLEGLAGSGDLHPLQTTALESGGVQCGFCTPGMLMTALDLLGSKPDPTEDEVKTALAGNLCRCTGYAKIVDGIMAAARAMQGRSEAGDD